MRQFILRSTDAGGASGPPPPESTSPVPSPGHISPTPAAPPPATLTVLEGTKTEVEIKLAAELEETKAALKTRELEVMQWQDENRRLKTPPKVGKADRPFRLGRFNLE